MSDDIISDGKTTNDEKSSGSGKLESMSREDLFKLVKNQFLLKKKLETKITELTSSTTNFSQIEDQLRQQINDEQSKYSKLIIEFDENKINQSKLQEELNTAHESLENFRLQNETLKTSCQNLQDEISILKNELSTVRLSLNDESQKSSSRSELFSQFLSTTIDLLQLPISLPDSTDNEFLEIYKNELEQKQENFKQAFDQIEQDKIQLQQRIEDLEFFNEEVKLENDDLTLKSSKYQHDKQLMEKEIDNYRRQIEDFEEQFLELQRESRTIKYDKSQQQPSITSSSVTLHQPDENFDEIIFQCMDYILNQIDDNNQQISKASSTSSLLLSSDISALLHSVGITNCTDEDFSVPFTFESVLRLCMLLIERCRVLQYILLKNNDISMNSLIDHNYEHDCVSFLQNNGFEQCRILIHKQDHIALDTLFERIYTGMNQKINSNDWQIVIEKPIDQSISSCLRLEFDNFKFVSEEVEHDLIHLRSQFDQLSKQNEEQKHEISVLEKRLHSNNSLSHLKDYQTQLEQQLTKQCEKTIQLENILKQENIDTINFDQFKHIELSYNELQEKYHIAEQLEGQLKQLNENFNEKDLQLKLQNDLCEKLKIDNERQHFYLLERDENIRLLNLALEQQKLLLSNATQDHDQRYSSILKQQEDLNDLIQIKTNENLQLISEKNKQIEDLEKELQSLNFNYKEIQIQFDQIKEEKKKLLNEIEFLLEKITSLENEKCEFIQNFDDLKQQLEINKLNLATTVETNSQAMDQETIHLQQTIENLKQEFELTTTNLQDIHLKESATNEHNQTTITNNLQSELETNRQENLKLNQTINELNNKYDKQNSDPAENIQEFKEKYHKMKILLTRLKKELQDRNQQPKQSLIDLELADYEKTINNLKNDLINKDKEIQELRDELSNTTDNYSCLKREIENLEQQKLHTDERANKFKALLDIAKKELQNAKDVELQRYHNDDHVRVLIETLQNELDNNKVFISELLNEKQQLTEKLNNHNETSQRTINLLEQNLRIAKHDLDIAKQDYDTLQDDFNSYKIRAQSVLKQHQSNQRERTPSLADKQVELEETIEKLKTTLQEANNKIQLLISENEAFQKEQNRLIEIQVKLVNESRKREQDLRKQHQNEINKIENENLQRINDSHDILKTVTLQNETLSTAYKEQIASMESDHERSISTLQNQLETSQQEIEQLKSRIDLLQQTNIDNEKLTSNLPETSQIGINNHSNRDTTLAWSDSEHQHEEESQLAKIDHRSPDIADKTLENILIDTTSIRSSLNDKPHHILIEDIELERQRIEEELNKTKLRLINTAELLNESELNNVRLNEQVTLLKDEIRRIERNMDRAESISNLEYLKNVILKFFILKSIPERLQLIPVLITMLKLSPDEHAQLVRVANIPPIIEENSTSNDSSIQQMSNGANTPSWGTYLNIW